MPLGHGYQRPGRAVIALVVLGLDETSHVGGEVIGDRISYLERGLIIRRSMIVQFGVLTRGSLMPWPEPRARHAGGCRRPPPPARASP